MKSKSFALLSLSILTVLVLTAFASAVSVSPTALTFNPFDTSKTFSVTNDGATDITLTSPITITDNQDPANSVTITLNDTTIAAGATETVTATLGTIPSDFSLGTFSTTYNVSAGVPLTLNFQNLPNEYADDGNLNIDDVSLSVENGFGPEDNEWYPLDEITAEIDISNEGDEKIKSINVEWGLYDTKNGKWIVSGEEDSFSLSDGDDTTLTIDFQIDKLNKLDLENTDDYKFYVWATGDDDGTDTSTYYSEDITLDIDSDFVVLSNFEIPETASCGNEVQITADVWNIGDSDQNDVYVVIYNKALGINKKVAIGDIDSMEDAKLETTLVLPDDVAKDTYTLQFSVYDEDSDIYENENDEKSMVSKELKVEGTCSLVPAVSVAATLGSEAKSGQELIIKATIANSGSDKEILNLGLSGYADWASLVSIDKTTVSLNAGQTTDVLITLKVNSDVSGDKKFDMVITEGDKILTQPIKVTIEKSSFQLPSSITGLFSGSSGNLYLWGIGALNVLLILIIIVVAVRVAKKK